MAKRFTDTDKWKMPFIRSMKAPYKLLWLYIQDECNHAGVWQVDMEVAELKIGERLKIEDAIKFFQNKIVIFDNEQKWFLPEFIEFQYGVLKNDNRAHASAIQLLRKWNLIDEENKPLTSPLQGDKDKEKDKEQVQDNDIINGDAEKSELEKSWDAFIEMRKKIKKPATDHAINLAKKKLIKLSGNDENMAIAILNQSVLNCYQDLYPLKNHTENHVLTNAQKSKHETLMDAAAEAKRQIDLEYGNQ